MLEFSSKKCDMLLINKPTYLLTYLKGSVLEMKSLILKRYEVILDLKKTKLETVITGRGGKTFPSGGTLAPNPSAGKSLSVS